MFEGILMRLILILKYFFFSFLFIYLAKLNRRRLSKCSYLSTCSTLPAAHFCSTSPENENENNLSYELRYICVQQDGKIVNILSISKKPDRLLPNESLLFEWLGFYEKKFKQK